ncbi:hypothetical protein C2G38_2231791, partial [Gigaspora rosea]
DENTVLRRRVGEVERRVKEASELEEENQELEEENREWRRRIEEVNRNHHLETVVFLGVVVVVTGARRLLRHSWCRGLSCIFVLTSSFLSVRNFFRSLTISSLVWVYVVEVSSFSLFRDILVGVGLDVREVLLLGLRW